MKRFLLVLLFPVVAAAWQLNYDVAVSNVEVGYSFPEAGHITVYNAGQSYPIRAAFGGHIVGATNDPATYYKKRFVIRPSASYTTLGKFSYVSLYCDTNAATSTRVDVNFEGHE